MEIFFISTRNFRAKRALLESRFSCPVPLLNRFGGLVSVGQFLGIYTPFSELVSNRQIGSHYRCIYCAYRCWLAALASLDHVLPFRYCKKYSRITPSRHFELYREFSCHSAPLHMTCIQGKSGASEKEVL